MSFGTRKENELTTLAFSSNDIKSMDDPNFVISSKDDDNEKELSPYSGGKKKLSIDDLKVFANITESTEERQEEKKSYHRKRKHKEDEEEESSSSDEERRHSKKKKEKEEEEPRQEEIPPPPKADEIPFVDKMFGSRQQYTEKAHILARLKRLKEKSGRNFTIDRDAPLEELQQQYAEIAYEIQSETQIKVYKRILAISVSFAEWAATLTPQGNDFKGWSDNFNLTLDDYDNALADIYDEYGAKIKLNPLANLALQVASHGFMYQLHNRMYRMQEEAARQQHPQAYQETEEVPTQSNELDSLMNIVSIPPPRVESTEEQEEIKQRENIKRKAQVEEEEEKKKVLIDVRKRRRTTKSNRNEITVTTEKE
jgi:hypothetical protein